jgi:hypothetical protein
LADRRQAGLVDIDDDDAAVVMGLRPGRLKEVEEREPGSLDKRGIGHPQRNGQGNQANR